MSRFTITVEFDIVEGGMAGFMPLMLDNARLSRDTEPGCERFDVLTPVGQANKVFLYEIYRDKDAFRAHVASVHFKSFDAATKTMIKDKRVVEYALED